MNKKNLKKCKDREVNDGTRHGGWEPVTSYYKEKNHQQQLDFSPPWLEESFVTRTRV
jgi:hypothetical protein